MFLNERDLLFDETPEYFEIPESERTEYFN